MWWLFSPPCATETETRSVTSNGQANQERPGAQSCSVVWPAAWSRRSSSNDRAGNAWSRCSAAIRNVVGEAQVRKGRVDLEVPPLVENGNTVSLVVVVDSPMTTTDYVKAIHVFNEKNPQPNVISVHLGPRAGKAKFSTRFRLADTQM